MVTYVTVERDMVDVIAKKHYGSHDGGTVEAVFNANPVLAAHPAFLPAGLVLTLPDLVTETTVATTRLWD
jgi:phage tail protein X